MMVDIEALEKLEAKALPGPWLWERADCKTKSNVMYTTRAGFHFDLIERDCGVYGPDVKTCEFIMAMRNNFRSLVRELEAARELIDALGTRELGGFLDWHKIRLASAHYDEVCR